MHRPDVVSATALTQQIDQWQCLISPGFVSEDPTDEHRTEADLIQGHVRCPVPTEL